jgi:ribonuclease HI
VIIKEDATIATEIHNKILERSRDLLIAYADGSGINGKIGAAAVTLQTGTMKQAYMGTNTTSTVYVAELEGIRMALETAAEIRWARGIVFSDSQAALKAIQTPREPSGQYIVIQIVQLLSELQLAGIRVDFYWIPAHQGIHGNKTADKAVKEATGWRNIRGGNRRSRGMDTEVTVCHEWLFMPSWLSSEAALSWVIGRSAYIVFAAAFARRPAISSNTTRVPIGPYSTTILYTLLL